MNKETFIAELSRKAEITQEQSTAVNEVLENNMIIGKKSREKITLEIAQTLSVDTDRANEIYRTPRDIIGTALKDKLKHPFGEQK